MYHDDLMYDEAFGPAVTYEHEALAYLFETFPSFALDDTYEDEYDLADETWDDNMDLTWADAPTDDDLRAIATWDDDEGG